jgi:fumarate hydratase subunit alpha
LVSKQVVENVAFNLLKLAVTKLPDDVKDALKRAYNNEDNPVGKSQLKAILDNLVLAEKNGTPMCQDTGIINFYVKVGNEIKNLNQIKESLINATIRATKKIPLRPNAVNPFTQNNSGDNTGRNIPYIHWEIGTGDCIELTVLPKGGGSENVSSLRMLNPSDGIEGLKKFVIETIINAGAKPCPPTIIGVAVGGGSDIAITLAKQTLLKPLNQPNLDLKLKKLEEELFEIANSLGIGPMGLGGKNTILDIKIDYAHRHPASYPVAVVVQCWAARRASAIINSDDTVEYMSHR